MNGVLLSIGTTHPWNIAGAGLDAHVAAEYAVPHAACIVAVSAQDERGLHALETLSPALVQAQLRSLPAVGAVRIGALVSSETVRLVADYVSALAPDIPVVVDPVLSVSLGGELAADDALEATLLETLLALPVVVTPNLPEAAQLLGRTDGDAAAFANAFVARGARAALITGGHGAGSSVQDVLADASGVRLFSAPRITASMRGTGCTLAAALACELLRGAVLDDAVAAAGAYVREKITARTMRGALQVAF